MHSHDTVPTRWTGTRPTPHLDLWLEHASSTVRAIRVFGDLDAETTPQLDELLERQWGRAAEVLVVDLSRATFVSMDALSLLTEANEQARAHGIALRLVTGPPCVDRALRATGLHTQFSLYPALATAVTDAVGFRGVSPGQERRITHAGAVIH